MRSFQIFDLRMKTMRMKWTAVSWAVPWWAGAMLACLMVTVPATQAQVATTTVQDTIYNADGTAASGTVIVSWPAFSTAVGQSIPAGSRSIVLGGGGSLSVALAPNAGGSPIGSYYTAIYHLNGGTVSREYWTVPVSSTAVTLAAIRSTVLPTAVAMQTVTKSYVDQAISAALAGGAQPLDSSPYVLKAGDTMTGPLVLPGDPVSALQAAEKQYVDENVSALTAGLAQKVSIVPSAGQTVIQPAGTTLAVNDLNGMLYATPYATGLGSNGIANAASSANCTNGCSITAEQTYTGTDQTAPYSLFGTQAFNWNSQTHLIDLRGGMRNESYMNPHNPFQAGDDAAEQIVLAVTNNAATQRQLYGTQFPGSFGLRIAHAGLTGGNNIFPENITSTAPYFKSGYTALQLQGHYTAQGQHILDAQEIDCYGVGDCLIGSRFLVSSGGYRDNADEGTHPYDFSVAEDAHVFQGTCSSGCSTGSRTITVSVTANPGTEGEGRFLIDKNPAGAITAGTITGGNYSGSPQPTAAFSGTSFPVSTLFQTAQAVLPQSTNMAPGTVTVGILTSGVPSGFATNTASAPNASGVACVSDALSGGVFGAYNYEMANYTTVDGTHFSLTLNKPHATAATIAIGGLCGYGIEQTVDTVNGIRQVFPVTGSFSSTGLYYAGGETNILGRNSTPGGYINASFSIASLSRASNVVTVTTSGALGADVNGLALTITGVADSSYNGTYTVTTTGANTFTYSQSGANSTSSGGTAAILTGGYVLYPMAEVLGVYDAATLSVDGVLTLAPNTVNWALADALEQPHFYKEAIKADQMVVSQTTPRGEVYQTAGITYQGNAGPGLRGWEIINQVPAANYLSNGGTHTAPDFAYKSTGIWNTVLDAQAGESSVFNVHCNSKGCGRWNSSYNLFQLDSTGGVDTVNYNPLTSMLTMNLRGTGYSFGTSSYSLPGLQYSGGNIGIGTGSPAALFSVGSTSQFQVDGSGDVSTSGMGLFGTSSALSSGTAVQMGGGSGAGKVIIYSNNNAYGQYQIGNPNLSEASMVFIEGVTAFGTSPASSGGNSNIWSLGAGIYGASGFGFGNKALGSWMWQVDQYGDVTQKGSVSATSYQETLYTPASSSAACTVGQFADDANYHYVCVATNTWKRVALSSF